jgi:hypothetical protein
MAKTALAPESRAIALQVRRESSIVWRDTGLQDEADSPITRIAPPLFSWNLLWPGEIQRAQIDAYGILLIKKGLKLSHVKNQECEQTEPKHKRGPQRRDRLVRGYYFLLPLLFHRRKRNLHRSSRESGRSIYRRVGPRASHLAHQNHDLGPKRANVELRGCFKVKSL